MLLSLWKLSAAVMALAVKLDDWAVWNDYQAMKFMSSFSKIVIFSVLVQSRNCFQHGKHVQYPCLAVPPWPLSCSNTLTAFQIMWSQSNISTSDHDPMLPPRDCEMKSIAEILCTFCAYISIEDVRCLFRFYSKFAQIFYTFFLGDNASLRWNAHHFLDHFWSCLKHLKCVYHYHPSCEKLFLFILLMFSYIINIFIFCIWSINFIDLNSWF